MALCFALGSLCFFVGPFPGYANLVGHSADAITFFVGSILRLTTVYTSLFVRAQDSLARRDQETMSSPNCLAAGDRGAGSPLLG